MVVKPLFPFAPEKGESLLWNSFLLTSSSGIICSVAIVLDLLVVCISLFIYEKINSLSWLLLHVKLDVTLIIDRPCSGWHLIEELHEFRVAYNHHTYSYRP